MRWLLLKDLQILRRSPLLVALLVVYPIVIAVLFGLALSGGPEKPRVAFATEGRETALLSMRGACSVTVDGTRYDIGLHDAIYVPRGCAVVVETTGEVDLVECAAEVAGSYPLQVIRYADLAADPGVDVPDLGTSALVLELDDTVEQVTAPPRVADVDLVQLLGGALPQPSAPEGSAADEALLACVEQAQTTEQLAACAPAG